MSDFTFIDLFAGIGGTRIAFQRAGGECVFTSEKDRYAQRTYSDYFKDHTLRGDITKVDKNKDIPDHDVLVAGFPCQPFSLAGVSKNKSMDRPHGFEHRTAGTMFDEILQVLRAKKPQAFMLENVKNLKGHNKGDTYRVIMSALGKGPNGLGYKVQSRVYDAAKFVPQHRERIFIVGYLDQDTSFDFANLDEKMKKRYRNKSLKSILDPDPIKSISKELYEALDRHRDKHQAENHGFGFSEVDPQERGVITRTISARYYKDGAEALIKVPGRKYPRKLSVDELKRLMGFPENFEFPKPHIRRKDYSKKTDIHAYKQLGNSVVIPLVTIIAKEIAKHL